MDLLDSLNILLRRWLLTLPLLLLTGAGVLAAMVILPWSYEAKATTVFLASPIQAKEVGGNPWLVFDGSLTVTAEVVGRELMDARTAAELRGRGLTAEYLVSVPPDTSGPVLQIDVTGENARTTEATLVALMKLIPEKLERIQADGGVAPYSRIKSRFVSSTPHADLKATDKIRTIAVILFAGLALTVAVPLSVESLATRRHQRERPEPATGRAGRGEPADPYGPYDARGTEAEAYPPPPRSAQATPPAGPVGRPSGENGLPPAHREPEPSGGTRESGPQPVQYEQETQAEQQRPARARNGLSRDGQSGRPRPKASARDRAKRMEALEALRQETGRPDVTRPEVPSGPRDQPRRAGTRRQDGQWSERDA